MPVLKTEEKERIKIERARNAGFCMGVKRAIQLAEDSLQKYGKTYCLRPLVHNEKVMNKLIDKGLTLIENPEALKSGAVLLLQAHGTEEEIVKQLQERELKIIDGTCPLVYEIHNYARELEEEGRKVIIIGDRDHEEVIAIASHLKKPVIITNHEEAAKLQKIKKAGIVIQSTQDFENVSAIIKELLDKVIDLRIVNTICNPTRLRQEEVQQLAVDNDMVLIVGSRTSANTKRLHQIALRTNRNSYLIQDVNDINPDWFRGVKSVGITAGASTPEVLIEEVEKWLKETLWR